jgi:hypothetical protein
MSELAKRESHVYPAALLIMENCPWLDSRDALEVSELLYSEGFLTLPAGLVKRCNNEMMRELAL